MRGATDGAERRPIAEFVDTAPATAGLIAAFVVVHLAKVAALRFYGPETTRAIFFVRAEALHYVWTWVTATFGHRNLAHLAINAYFAVTVGRLAERLLGRRRYLTVFVLGGTITAVCGTLLHANVTGHLLVDIGLVPHGPTAPVWWGAAGSSMGWFVVLGTVLAGEPSYTNVVGGFRVDSWVLFVLVGAVSAVGTVVDVWLFSIPIGHPYHLVGLCLGGVYATILRRVWSTVDRHPVFVGGTDGR